MGDGPELNVVNVLLAALPLAALLASILALKWSAPRAGAAAFLVVAVIALLFFESDPGLLAIGSAKGLSLSFFVLSIIWTSVLLYNVVDELGGIDVIGRTMTRLVEDPLAQALVVGWAFSGFMQGIAGFGVPVAVVAPLMVFMGFGAARAAAIVLVGHAWAVTFGSLGSSYFTIQLVTEIPGEEIGPHMAALFALPTIVTGFAVAHLQGGMSSLRRGIPIVLVMGGSMALCLWVLASVGAPQVASLVSGLVGCGVGWLVAKTPLLPSPAKEQEQHRTAPESKGGPSFHMAFLPYYAVLALSVLSQVPAVKELGDSLCRDLDYPLTCLGPGLPGDGDGHGLHGGCAGQLREDQAAAASRSPDTAVACANVRYLPRSTELETRRGALGDQEDLLPVRPDQRGNRDHGHDGPGHDRHGHDRPPGQDDCRHHSDGLPRVLAVHRRAGDIHDGEQHELERDVRRAPAGDGRRPRRLRGHHRRGAVDRWVRSGAPSPLPRCWSARPSWACRARRAR